jgi:hypothetical protein
LDYHTAQLFAWRRLRNSRNWVNRLPIEVLTRIIDHCRPNDWDGQGVRYERFISLLCVCRHWQTVMLGDPVLWTLVPCWSRKATVLMLERSRQAPLIVSINPGTIPDLNMSAHQAELSVKKWIKDTTQLLILHKDRVSCLYFENLARGPLCSLVVNATWLILSRLASLRDVYVTKSGPLVSWFVSNGYLGGNAPNVHSLHLGSCAIPRPGWPGYCRLISLVLDHVHDSAEEPAQLGAVLREATGMRRLEPRQSQFDIEETENTIVPLVLGHLTHLVVVESDRAAIYLAQRLVCPSLMHLEMGSNLTTSAAANNEDLYNPAQFVSGFLESELLRQFIKQNPRLTSWGLRMSVFYPVHAGSGLQADLLASPLLEPKSPRLIVSLYSASDEGCTAVKSSFEQMFVWLHRPLVPQIEALHVHPYSARLLDTEEAWTRGAFQTPFTSLKTLVVSGSAVTGLVQALGSRLRTLSTTSFVTLSGGDPKADRSPFFFPALRFLSLNFSAFLLRDRKEDTLLPTLHRQMQRRAEAGMALEELRVVDYFPSSSQDSFERLRTAGLVKNIAYVGWNQDEA